MRRYIVIYYGVLFVYLFFCTHVCVCVSVHVVVILTKEQIIIIIALQKK